MSGLGVDAKHVGALTDMQVHLKFVDMVLVVECDLDVLHPAGFII